MRMLTRIYPQKVLACNGFDFFSVLIFLLTILSFATTAFAENQISILVTSNLQGNFSLEVKNQETTDPLLILGQNILSERNKGVDLYLDMGNALYPGVLSKFSSGALMMDFFEYFSCNAVLVSSKDLQIGTKNLEFLQKSKKVCLLSSNILQDDKPIFKPWFTFQRADTRIAVLGVSSKKVRFDMAEKDLYGYNLAEDQEALDPFVKEIRAAGIQHIILLSGLSLKETASILQTYPDIGIALCGGDYTGGLFSGKVSRVDLNDGRSVLIADESVDYYRLNIVVDDKIRVQSLEPRKAMPIETYNYYYQEFKERLSLWKDKFLADEHQLVATLSETEFRVDDQHFAQLLRDRFDCEMGVVETDTLNALPVNQAIKQSDFLGMVNRDYNIFVFSLSGDQVKKLSTESEGLVIAGMDTEKEVKIQGYALESNRRYRVAASQPAMQRIRRLVDKDLDYHNTWMTVTDLLMDDLKKDRIVLRKDYDYLDRRFRTTVDAYLANFIDNSSVSRDDNIDTPVGQPSKSYNKWGLENKIDFTVYNKYHRFVFTPYMLYSRQDDSYLNNILRGTFLYDYNWSEIFKPYNKFQIDTVVVEEKVEKDDGEEVKVRPVLLRETCGVSTAYKKFTGKLGFGLEKEVQYPAIDPDPDPLYGFELIMGLEIPFLSHFTYSFNLDSFSGLRRDEFGDSQWQIRSEINNIVSAKINTHMSVSFRHKYFYLHEDMPGDIPSESYQNSQFITSLDLKNDWKFW